MQAMMDNLTQHMSGWILLGILAIMMIGMAIAGLILLILYRKAFTLDPGIITIPEEKRWNTILGNGGMIALCIFWILVIIAQLIM